MKVALTARGWRESRETREKALQQWGQKVVLGLEGGVKEGELVYQIKGCIPRIDQTWAKTPKYDPEAVYIFSEHCSTSELEPQTAEHYRIMPFWNECCFFLVPHLALNFIPPKWKKTRNKKKPSYSHPKKYSC